MHEKTQSSYHPLQVSLHWLIVLLILATFVLGKFLSAQPNEADKISLIAFHMALGLVILITMVVRMIVRYRLPKPSPASTGNSILDIVAKLVHGALYLFVLLMAVSGLSLSIQSGLTLIIFGGSGAPLSPDFNAFNARILHGIIAPVLLFLILLHTGAALYHQFFLKDRLLARMWYRKAQI